MPSSVTQPGVPSSASGYDAGMWGLLLICCAADFDRVPVESPDLRTVAADDDAKHGARVAAAKRDVGFLASDSLGGRMRGSEGGHAAAAFLAGGLARLGWQPFDGQFRHEFPARGAKPRELRLQNVVAVSRPLQPGEQVVLVGAHYDHVGTGRSGGSFGPRGLVHNGADDNASGTAAVLAVARALAARPLPALHRPVAVAFFDGEEGGLLGSKRFADEHADRVAAMINLDMVGQLYDDTVYVWGADTAAFAAPLDAVETQLGLRLDRRAEHIKRSDHWPFFDHDTPYLMLHTGLHPRYHRPEDDADRLDYDGIVRIAAATESLARSLADPATDLTLRAASKTQPIVPAPPWQPWTEQAATIERERREAAEGDADADAKNSNEAAAKAQP